MPNLTFDELLEQAGMISPLSSDPAINRELNRIISGKPMPKKRREISGGWDEVTEKLKTVHAERMRRKLEENKAKRAMLEKPKLAIIPSQKQGKWGTEFGFVGGTVKEPKVEGIATYHKEDKAITVNQIIPTDVKSDETYQDLHKRAAGKTLNPKLTQGLLQKLKDRFPRAEVVEGGRITGRHAEMPIGKSVQRLKLKKGGMLGLLGVGLGFAEKYMRENRPPGT